MRWRAKRRAANAGPRPIISGTRLPGARPPWSETPAQRPSAALQSAGDAGHRSQRLPSKRRRPRTIASAGSRSINRAARPPARPSGAAAALQRQPRPTYLLPPQPGTSRPGPPGDTRPGTAPAIWPAPCEEQAAQAASGQAEAVLQGSRRGAGRTPCRVAGSQGERVPLPRQAEQATRCAHRHRKGAPRLAAQRSATAGALVPSAPRRTCSRLPSGGTLTQSGDGPTRGTKSALRR